MYSNRLILLFLALLLFRSCGPKTQDRKQRGTEQAAAAISDTLSYTVQTVRDSYGDCTQKGSGCARVVFSYPQFHAAQTSSPVSQINEYIQTHLSISLLSGDTLENPETAAAEFVADYAEFLSDNPPYATQWTWEKRIQRLYESEKILACELEAYSFTGGAHGRQVTQYWNFDPATGRPIPLAKLVVPGSLPDLQHSAEQTFRKLNNIPADATLEQFGYWFEENQFQLPENFSISADTLTFLYNPYEIAPYVYGKIMIRLPIREIKELLRPAWITP